MSSNLGMVWVVIRAEAAKSRLVELIDNGRLAEASGLSYSLNSLIEKVKSFVQQYGGSVILSIYERIIFSLPVDVAKDLPNIIEGFNETLGKDLAVGIGIDFKEASKAAEKSCQTGEIELFDIKNIDGDKIDYYSSKAEPTTTSRRFTEQVVVPPNLFDPTIPDDKEWKEDKDKKEDKPPKRLSPEEDLQIEAKYLQMVAEQIMGPAQQSDGQSAPNPSNVGTKGNTRDLLEALNGGQIQGYQPKMMQPQESPSAENPPPSDKGSDVASTVTEAEDEAKGFNDKLALMLHNVKSQLPQLMALADKNPEAYKQSMNVIQKLVTMAHSRKKSMSKSEDRKNLDELEKDINDRLSSFKIKSPTMPVGTRKGNYKKVIVNGKEVWREMSSGQILDDNGQPISVRSSNRKAKTDSDI